MPNDDLRSIRTGLYLEYTTLAWNIVGTVVIVIAAIHTGSAAYAGFGLDSLIEIFASTIVVWQLKGVNAQRESRALRLLSVAFGALSLYVFAQSIYVFTIGHRPGVSLVGAVWLVVTVIVMLLLAWGKSVTGKKLGNAVLMTEAHVTLVDAYLAAAVLAGAVLDAWLGWWWADPLAGLVIVYYGAKEAKAAWHHSTNIISTID
ncbi:cation diffusion facilitator family transporter [Acidisoma silvae]|uniref:Cation transporter n=1 Tax=Acidisoma silvae TaxID=2802396 RepID=A0A964E137_9PROT|nr:hypothetical protein [Acidisoma silvae]MCB8877951.1 hypothetical protein [Acidisoma silvae]